MIQVNKMACPDLSNLQLLDDVPEERQYQHEGLGQPDQLDYLDLALSYRFEWF